MPALTQPPSSDSARLEALHRYCILDTAPEEAFDRVAKLASTFFATPTAFISFIDQDRQWFKACHGLNLVEMPRDTSFCTYTIALEDGLIVPDTRQDKRFCRIPFVAGEPGFRFYAGAPLRTRDGHNIGTLFIADFVPRLRFSPEQRSVLEDLSAVVMESLEARCDAHLAEVNKKHLKHIIESSSDLIYTKDIEGRYTFLNRPPLDDEGPQVADIIGKTDFELFPESAEQFRRFDKQVIETQQSLLREETLYINNQKIINQSHKKPFFTSDGELAGILGISRDITEEVHIREELEQSLALLKATFDATLDGIFIVSLDLEVLGFNQRYADIWQIPIDSLNATDADTFISFVKASVKDPEALAVDLQKPREQPEKVHNFVWELKDGRYIEVSSAPQRRGGELSGRVISFRDITEQVRTRGELERSLTLLKATLEATTEGILSVDIDRKILVTNKRYKSMRSVPKSILELKDDHTLIDYIKQQHKNPDAWVEATEDIYRHPEKASNDTVEMVDGKVFERSSYPMRVGDTVLGRVWSFRDVTEAVHNHHELERSLSLLTTTFDAINEGILSVGLDGVIHSFNQTYIDMWNVPDDVINMRDDGELIAHARGHYVDPATHLDKLEVVLKNPEATFKDIGELKDGRFIERTLTPQRLNGEVTGRVWTFRDVTNEFRTAQALRDSEEKFRELAENIDDMFWLASSNLDETLYVSPAYEKIWGRSVEAAYNDAKDYLDAIHPADKTRVLKAMERMLEGNYNEIYRIIHPDGSLRWVRDRAFPIYNDNGTIKRYAGVTQDISERVSFEQRLEESEKRTRTVLESITDAFFSLDRKWRFTYINEQAKTYLSTADTDLLYKNVWQTLPQLESSSFYTRCHVAVSSGKAVMFEEYFSIIDTWFDIHIYPSAEGLSVYFHDISERRQHQEHLRQAKEEAERANRAKSEFLSRMSHELRTPLNAILGFGQLLRMGDLSEEDSEAAKDIVKAGEHLLELINEVLDIARIESGHLALSLEPICFAEALNEVLEMLRPLTQNAKLNLQTNVPAETYVKADWQRLKQVLLNLLSNAIKYNVEGGEVHIDLHREGDQSVITVRDTGVGIAPEMLPRVFEPFDRLGAERTEVEGTGIGLSLTKHLVELMGGTISVESRLGEGSRFKVRLAATPNPVLGMPSLNTGNTATQQSRNYKVVYIEDNLTNLKLVKRIFADMTNLELLSTVQGRIGIELAVQHMPDLILLDLHLPDIPGSEVLHQLRSEELTKHIPVLVISADAISERRQEILDAGADAYLSKPLKLADFTSKVHALLEHP